MEQLHRSCTKIPPTFVTLTRDLLYWLNELDPVVLILYDAQEDKAHWLYVQEYFRGQSWAERAAAATTATVHVPSSNLVDDAVIRLFARFRDERLAARRGE